MNGQMITLYDRGSHIPLVWTHLIPATLEGRALHNVQNAMFAAAMAYSLGIKLDAIRHGLRTFDIDVLPGAGPHERVQRAPVQGALRLRPQRARGGRHGRSRAAARSRGPAHRRARRARATVATRTCAPSPTRWPAASTTTSAGATTACAVAAATRCRSCRPRSCSCAACLPPPSRSSRTSRRRSRPHSTWASRATCCWCSRTR